jgi:hypothetical protein
MTHFLQFPPPDNPHKLLQMAAEAWGLLVLDGSPREVEEAASPAAVQDVSMSLDSALSTATVAAVEAKLAEVGE